MNRVACMCPGLNRLASYRHRAGAEVVELADTLVSGAYSSAGSFLGSRM